MDCYFKPADLDKFVRRKRCCNRYFTYSQLIKRWQGRITETEAVALIKFKCEVGELSAYHPIAGIIIVDGVRWRDVDGSPLIEDGMFSEAEVKSLEVEIECLSCPGSKGTTDAANRSRADEQTTRRAALVSFVHPADSRARYEKKSIMGRLCSSESLIQASLPARFQFVHQVLHVRPATKLELTVVAEFVAVEIGQCLTLLQARDGESID